MRSVIAAIPALAALLGALAPALGCRAAPPVTAPASAGPSVPNQADAVAQEAVDARVTMLLHLDRLQGFRFSKRLILLGGWNEALAGTGVDPLTDVHRAFVAAHASHNGDVALVLEHSAPEDRVLAAIATLQKKWLAGPPVTEASDVLPDLSRFPFPAAYRYMKNDFAHIDGPALLAEPHPGLIVVLPPSRAVEAFRFMEAGSLPGPKGGEAMVFRAWDPVSSIQNGPSWSPEVRYAEAVFAFDGEGNSTLKFRAVCSSSEAARTEAARMTTQVDDAQSIEVGGARLRLFDYIEFHADKDRVKMKTNLLADDVDWLVAMSMKPL